MNKRDAPSAIQTNVLGKIHSGTVRMRPRIYFTILWLLGVLTSIAAGLLVAYLMNMLTYIIRIYTATTPAYGARQNLSQAIASFPWWAVVLSFTLAAAAIWLMRKYGRIYRYRMSVIIIGFLAISVIIGVGMSYANIGHPDRPNSHPYPTEQRGLGGGPGRGPGSRNN